MSNSAASSIGRVLSFIGQVALTVAFGIMTWAFWGLYNQEKLSNLFAKEGQMITVKVTEVSSAKKVWTDYLGNIKYISFPYNGKQYSTRYVQDTLFISEGTLVPLLYHPASDAFRQPAKQFNMKVDSSKSRLLKWTAFSMFSTENRWLLLCLMISVAFFMFLAGLLSQIPGLAFLRHAGRIVFIVLLFVVAVYISYDAFAYYKYYQHIKTTGQQMQVTVVKKYVVRSFNRDDYFTDSYSAAVNFQNKEREIPIDEKEYDQLKEGAKLNVYYDESYDDMMSVNHSLYWFNFLFPLLVWLILIVGFAGTYKRRKK